MWPLYFAVGLVNVLAKSNNYGININNTEMDIRVKRDIQNTVDISSFSHSSEHTEENIQPISVYLKNGDEKPRKHVISKRSHHNNGMYVPHRSHNQAKESYQVIGLDKSKEDNKPIEFNQQNNFNRYSPNSLPEPLAYTKTETTTSKPWYKKLFSVFSGNSTPNGVATPGVENNRVGALKKKKRKHKIMAACVICDIPCPAGYTKQQSFCVEDDPDYS